MWWFLAFGVITFSTCDGSTLAEIKLANPITQFSNEFYQHFGKVDNGNMVYSPYSIHTVMAMALSGSPEDSSTHKQLSKALKATGLDLKDYNIGYSLLRSHYKVVRERNLAEDEYCDPSELYDDYAAYYGGEPTCDDTPDLDIRTGYRLYFQQDLDIKSEYRQSLDTYYRAGNTRNDFEDLVNDALRQEFYHCVSPILQIIILDARGVDFTLGMKTAKMINKYVNKSTNGLIEKLVEPDSFDGNTKLMLINAVYFFGKWKTEFEKDDTQPGKFTVEENKEPEVKYMNLNENFNQVKSDSSWVLEMPYKDEEFSMYFILPSENVDIRDFDWKELDLQNVNDRMENVPTVVKLPKFEIVYEKKLQTLFKDLGAGDAFGPTGT